MSATRYNKRLALPFGLAAPAIEIAESHFELVHPIEKADVVACLFLPEALPGWRSYEGATRLIDLTCDLESIFGGFTKDTRYEINRASQRDGVEVSMSANPLEAQLSEFLDYYDDFAASKGVAHIRREHVRALASMGKIAISVAKNKDDSVLAAHAYLTGPSRVRLTHSASLFRFEHDPRARAQIGRANRYLHWNDLIAFREMGAESYDFGGWYEGSRDAALLKINAFKGEFGGSVAKEWNSFKAGSRLGSAYLAVRDLMLRRRR